VLITIHLIAHQHTYIAHHTSHSLIYNTSFIIYLIAIDVFFGSTLNRQGSEHSNRKRCLSFKASKVIIESCHRWTSPLCQFYYLYLLFSNNPTYTPNIIQLISALLSSSTSILNKSVDQPIIQPLHRSSYHQPIQDSLYICIPSKRRLTNCTLLLWN